MHTQRKTDTYRQTHTEIQRERHTQTHMHNKHTYTHNPILHNLQNKQPIGFDVSWQA